MEFTGATIWLRKTVESDVFYNKPDKWFKIWFFIINKVNHKDNNLFKRGSNLITYNEITLYTKATKGQIDQFIRWSKSCKMLTTQKTTRGMIVFVLNYAKYQDYIKRKNDTENDSSTTQPRHSHDTINNNDNNDKNNNISKDIQTSSEYGNEDINWLIKEFETIRGFKSTGGKKDRIMAKHLLNNFTREQLTYMLNFCDKPFAPRIGSICDLWFLRGKILAGIKDLKNDKSKITIIG